MRFLFRKENFTPYLIFTSISLIGIFTFFIYAFIVGEDAFVWISMANTGKKNFLDFFSHVIFVAQPEHLYERAQGIWGCFPPLIYLLYYFFYRITAVVGYEPIAKDITLVYSDYMYRDYKLVVFMYYTVFSVLMMLFSIRICGQGKKYKRLLICLLLSVPFFAGGIEHGNSCVLVFSLLLVALKWRDSDSAIKKELAMVMIAMSAGIKIYPAIFGLLYIREGKFREVIRLLIYGVILFFGPFVMFGGFNGFRLWLGNIAYSMSYYNNGCIEYIYGLVSTLTQWLFGSPFLYLSLLIPNLFLILMSLLSIVSENKYRSIFFLCAIMVFYPTNAYRYTLVYLSIPLVMYLIENGQSEIKNVWIYLEMIIFGLLFSIPMLWGAITGFKLKFAITSQFTYVEFWVYLMAYVLLAIFICKDLMNVIIYKKYNQIIRVQLKNTIKNGG